MTIRKPIVLTVTRRFDQKPERVFDAWLDPETARRWLFATETGEMVRAEIEPQVGGAYLFTERREGRDIDHSGTYLVIDRPRRLSFTFAVPEFSADAATVTIDIVPDGEGCVLTLTQEMGADHARWKKPTEEGWATILGNLAKRLEAD